ncbi:MAG TPA: hypothetical protein VGN76_09190 [Gemmatimonadales bacterium]|nr:hypothetical protein [Gemmatimonadales bacterium]
MRAKSRRKLEMGQRVLEFCRQHQDLGPGLAAATARLRERLDRAAELARQQLDGRSEVHAATTRKIELRRLMMKAHLDHLASVAQFASVEDPDVIQKFNFPPDATTYLAFRAAASGMAAEAESRKELLLKHGLSEEILTGLKTSLDQFETALEQGAAGRVARVSATAELNAVAEEVVQEVKVMNGQVRFKFATQPEVLAAWESASNVVAAPKPEDKPVTGSTPPAGGTPPGAGEVRPAA